MDRFLILVVLSAIAVGLALLLQRRRPEPPTAPSYKAPTQLDRADFASPETPILVVSFTSRTCNSCAATWQAVAEGAGERMQVVTQNVELQADPGGLHKRYKIDGVPTTLIAGAEGIVHASFFGEMSAQAISDALG
jgi:hypothetical protein